MLSELEKYRRFAIDAANELGYGEDVIDQLIAAKTETKITNIMTFAREDLGREFHTPAPRARYSLRKAANYISRRRKPVEKVDLSGNVIKSYDSVTEAAEDNHISRSRLVARCRGEVNQAYLLEDYTFRYKQQS